MHLLNTRPKEEADKLATELSQRGVASTVSPLLEIELLPPDAQALAGAQGLIATSRNGLKALALSAAHHQALALPLFAVGPGTAELARSLRISNIVTGPGAARDLVPVVLAHARPGAGRLVQLGGDKLAFDLKGALTSSGVHLDVLTVYRSRPAPAFTPEALFGLRQGAIDTVLLTSPLAARAFVALANEAGLRQTCQRLVYVCLSQQIATMLAPPDPSTVHVASAPNTEATLDVIDGLIGRKPGAVGY